MTRPKLFDLLQEWRLVPNIPSVRTSIVFLSFINRMETWVTPFLLNLSIVVNMTIISLPSFVLDQLRTLIFLEFLRHSILSVSLESIAQVELWSVIFRRSSFIEVGLILDECCIVRLAKVIEIGRFVLSVWRMIVIDWMSIRLSPCLKSLH